MSTKTARRPLTAEMIRRCAETAPEPTAEQLALIRRLMPPVAVAVAESLSGRTA